MTEPVDPTRMRDQRELTTASGATWLIVGAITTALVGGMLLALGGTFGDARAFIGAALIGVVMAAMIVVRVAVRARPTRLRLLAVLFGLMLTIGLVVVLLVAAG